jgi:hypothetical protein
MRSLAVSLVVLLLAVVVGAPLVARIFDLGPDRSVRPPRSKAVPIGNGLSLNVVDVGSCPPVVLVHGVPSCVSD